MEALYIWYFNASVKEAIYFLWNIDLDAMLEAPSLKYLFFVLAESKHEFLLIWNTKMWGSSVLGDSSFPISKKASLRFNFTATPELPKHYQNDLENPALLRDLTSTPW